MEEESGKNKVAIMLDVSYKGVIQQGRMWASQTERRIPKRMGKKWNSALCRPHMTKGGGAKCVIGRQEGSEGEFKEGSIIVV